MGESSTSTTNTDVSSNVITVHTTDELIAAINKLDASGGGEIRVAGRDLPYTLKGSNYGTLDSEIRIVADDPNDPPVFSNISIVGGRNLTFDGIVVDSSSLAEDTQSQDVMIRSSLGITFQNCEFRSDADGFYTGDDSVTRGENMARFDKVQDVVFRDNIMTGHYHGLELRNVTGLVVEGNEFSQFQGDGLRMMGVQDAVISDNTFIDPFGASHDINHSDMIQIMSGYYGTNNSENIEISGNFFSSGDGTATQTILIRSEDADAGGNRFQNIVVTDNVIYNGHQHGILVQGVDAAYIASNTLLWNESSGHYATPNSDPKYMVPLITLEDVNDGLVRDNVVGGINASGDVTTIDNHIVSFGDPTADNYVGNNFVNAVGGGARSLEDLSMFPESILFAKGAALSSQGSFVETATGGILSQMQTDFSGQTFSYSLEDLWVDGVFIDPDMADFTWTFSDGVVVTGQTVERTFEGSGIFTAVLEIETETLSFMMGTQTEVVTSLTFEYDPNTPLATGEFWLNGEVVQLLDDAVQKQDIVGEATVVTATGVQLAGNTWKGVDMDVLITEDSILHFDFSSDAEGEIHAIGFTNGDSLTPEAMFQIDGTQTYGLQDFNNLYETGSGVQSYEIEVGKYVTGSFDRIVFVMDDDANAMGESTFANIDFI